HKRLLRRNRMSKYGLRALLRNRHQGIAVDVIATVGPEAKIVPDAKRLQLELRAHSEIARQQSQHNVRLLSQRFEQRRKSRHEATWAMWLLQGQTQVGNIALVEHLDRHHGLVHLMLPECFAQDSGVGLARHLD